jgi:hypothetical protein
MDNINLNELVKVNKDNKQYNINQDNIKQETNIEEEIKSNVESMEIYSPTHPFRLSLRIKNFEDEKQYKSFIKKCEQLIRNSIEYKL